MRTQLLHAEGGIPASAVFRSKTSLATTDRGNDDHPLAGEDRVPDIAGIHRRCVTGKLIEAPFACCSAAAPNSASTATPTPNRLTQPWARRSRGNASSAGDDPKRGNVFSFCMGVS